MSLPPPGSTAVDAYEDTVVTPKWPKPRRPAKPFSCFRFCAILAIIICVVVGGLVTFLLVSTARGVMRSFHSPHGDLYAAPGTNKSTVQPLIDKDTLFDVAVTVWARRANADTAHPEIYADDWADGIDFTEAQGSLRSRVGMPLVEFSHLPEEDIIFSQVVIKDCSLNDKDRDVDVNFELPLARFEDKWIYPNDVRAAVTINPRSPSALDRVTNFSSVKPTAMQWPRLDTILAWGEDGSLHRAVVEDIAVSIPLVKMVSRYNLSSADMDSMDELLHPNEPIWAQESPKHHPYLVNRAHVYLVNETRLLDREVWETKFKMRSDQAWDKSLVSGTRFVNHNSSYEIAGHWNARYELAGDVDEEGNPPLAYNPYFGVMQHGAGPLHHVRLPVTRPNVANMEDAPEAQRGPASINVTLSLRVSVFQPYRERLFNLKDTVADQMSPAYNGTELELKHAHYWWDLSHGLLGSTVDTGHAWKRVLFVALHLSGNVLSWLLAVLYWYTRQTTAGISHRSALFLLVSETLNMYRIGASKEIDQGLKILSLIIMCIGQLPLLLQVWLVMPITVGDERRGWTIHWRRWTHRERATVRLQLSWLYTFGVFFASMGLFWVCQGLEASWLVKPEQTQKQYMADTKWIGFISIPARVTSVLLQLFTNARAMSFAGAYALEAYMVLASGLFNILYNSTRFMGAYYARPGYHVFEIVAAVAALGAAFQAATLPRVEQNQPEEDE